MGADKGFLNASIDYANAMKDIRTVEESYDRGTFSVGYTNTFNRDRTPFQFNAKVSGYLSRGTTTAAPAPPLTPPGQAQRTVRFPAGRRPSWKKAMVTLTADSKTIEFFEGMV